MSHCSIAIIKKRINYNDANTHSHKGDEFEFLVFEKGEIYHFLEIYALAVNGIFDYSRLKNRIYQELKLSQDSEFESKEFFKKSDIDNSTTYDFILSASQINEVNLKDNILWIKQSDLAKHKGNWKKNQQYIFDNEEPFTIPNISNKFRADLRNIIEAKNKGRLVIFAGAGVSVDSGLPSWVELIEQLKAEMNTEQKDREVIAQEHLKERGKTEYNKRVREILKHKQSQFNPLHQKIVELNPLHIITTNYDELFEEAIKEKGTANYSIIRQDSDLPYAESSRLMIKMHGDLEFKNFVLTQKDYKKYSKKFPLIESTVKSIFASKLVIFVGFSYDDDNLKRIIKTISDILKGDIQKPYLILPTDEEIKKIENIHVIKLNKKDLLKVSKKPAPDNLKAKGRDIYTFLDILLSVDINALINESYHIEQHLVNQLSRFKELPFIPYKTIQSLTPFKALSKAEYGKDENAKYSIIDFHLKTQNENLLKYFKNEKTVEKNAANVHSAMLHINRSLIQYISRKGDTNPIYYAINSKKEENCYCHRCCDDNFNYKLLLENLKEPNQNIKCTKDIYDNELLPAYGLFVTGQSKAAYYELEKIKQNALSKKKFITYYLALVNQVSLNQHLGWGYDFKNIKVLDKVENSINAIDLAWELFNINIDDDVKECLKLISGNSILKGLKYDLDKYFEDVLSMYKRCKKDKSYFRLGSDSYKNYDKTFTYLALYYHTNILFFIETFEFRELCLKYVEVSIARFQAYSKFVRKLERLSENFVYAFIKKVSVKKNINLLKKYEVTSLKLYNDKGVDVLIKKYSNLITSGIEKFQITSGTFVNYELKYHTENSHYFENKLANEACNFILLFCHLNLEDENTVNNILLSSLDFNNKLSLYGGDYFEVHLLFIEKYIAHIKDETLNILLDSILNSDKLTNKFIRIVSEKSNFKLEAKKSKEIIEKYFSEKHFLLKYMSLYKLFADEEKKLAKSSLVKALKDKNDVPLRQFSINPKNDILGNAFYLEIFDVDNDKDVLESYLNSFEEIKKIPSDYFEGEEKEKTRYYRRLILNLIYIIYKENLFENPIVIDLIDNIKTPKYKWILNPAKFDYINFEVSWLIEFYGKFDEQVTKNMVVKFKQIPNIEDIIKKELKQNYNDKLAQLLLKEFVVNKPK